MIGEGNIYIVPLDDLSSSGWAPCRNRSPPVREADPAAACCSRWRHWTAARAAAACGRTGGGFADRNGFPEAGLAASRWWYWLRGPDASLPTLAQASSDCCCYYHHHCRLELKIEMTELLFLGHCDIVWRCWLFEVNSVVLHVSFQNIWATIIYTR